jgi:hypothetical protein
MSLTIDLPPDLESRVREEAGKHGLDAGEYTLKLIQQNLPEMKAKPGCLWNTLTPEEWLHAFDEWANSHDTSIPPLSDDAVSRESFYEGRS